MTWFTTHMTCYELYQCTHLRAAHIIVMGNHYHSATVTQHSDFRLVHNFSCSYMKHHRMELFLLFQPLLWHDATIEAAAVRKGIPPISIERSFVRV